MTSKREPDAIGIRIPERREFQDCAKLVGKSVQPDWLPKGREYKHSAGHEGGALTSVRTAEHKGRTIVIRTTYEIEVDGLAYHGHAQVDEDGRIHCHAIPYDTHPSAVAFVKQLIDLYPESFPGGDDSASCDPAKDGRQVKG